MCRFNLILIKDEDAEELLEQEGYQIFNVSLPGYKAFQKGYCNCGSFVGSLIQKKGMPYKDALAASKKEKLDRLYQIRDFMNQPGYRERKEEYNQKQGMLFEELQVFSDPINEYERNRSKEIREKYDEENFSIQMENLHGEINKMFTELDQQQEYQKMQETLMNMQHDNELMNESLCYYRTKEEQEMANSGSIPLSDLLGLEGEQSPEEFEIIDFKEESFVIDEVISRTENDTFEDNLCEFNSYFKLMTDLLNNVPSLLFATIWSEPNDLTKIKTIPIGSLIIDDLAFLDFDEMICIEK